MSLVLPSFQETYSRVYNNILNKKPFNDESELDCFLASVLYQPISLPYQQASYFENHMKRQRQELQSDHEEDSTFTNPVPAKKQKRSCFIVKGKEMKAFFGLLADELIQDFLDMDSCKKIADKYLVAMVFAYFKRAGYSLREYSRTNFFIALYLANDVEEDEEELKYEIFPWALGKKWKKKYPNFLAKRDKLLKRVNYRAIVSRRCCEEIMAIEPGHKVWSRERPEHHGGAIRAYMQEMDDTYPQGPNGSPRFCSLCDISDSQYDSASPSNYSWYISSIESSPDMTSSSDSRFDMKGLKRTLPVPLPPVPVGPVNYSEDVWPTIEE